MKPRNTPARLTVPQWLYESADNIVKRVVDVEKLIADLRFVEQPLKVSVSQEFFDKILKDEYVKQSYQFYQETGRKSIVMSEEEQALDTLWFKLSKTLFVVEE